MNRWSSNRGSLSLTYMYSSIAALGFSLLVYNFSHYLTAQSAVEQAARAAARCIEPTDGECVAALINPGDPGSIVTNWYGYEADSAQVQASTDLFDYTSEMYKRTTNAHYNSFDIHWDEPRAEWQEVLVPLRSFNTQLNMFLDTFGTMVLPTFEGSQYFAPLYQGAGLKIFPPEAIEDDIMNHATPAQMVAWQANLGNNVAWTTYNIPGWQVIPPQGTHLMVQTDWIDVPQLDPASNNDCRMANGTHCNQKVNTNSGDDLPQSQWKDWVRVAFIPMSNIRNTGSSSSSVSWRHIDNLNQPGLKMFVDDGQGNSWSYCLGGRRATSFSPGTKWFNMDIRGPAGSNDGARGACPGNGGLGDFDSLRVPRGGKFRIRAFIRRDDNNVGPNQMEANVRFLVTMDEYQVQTEQSPGPNISCPNVQFSTASSTPRCDQISWSSCQGWNPGLTPDQSVCDYPFWPSYYTWGPMIPNCINDGHAFLITPQMRPFNEMTGPQNVAVCEGSWEPPTSMYPAPPSGSIQCGGWTTTSGSPALQQVAALSSQCSLAQISEQEFSCENRVPYGNPVSINECDGLESGIDESAIEAQTAALNAEQQAYPGAPQFSVDLVVAMAPDPVNYWEFSWSKLFEGLPLSNPDQIRDAAAGNPKSLEPVSEAISWKSTSGSYNEPPVSYFFGAIQAHAGFGESAYGWQDFASGGAQYAWTTSVDQTIQINDVWPYNPAEGPQPRPYHDLIPLSGSYDYDLDCLVETECGGSYPSYQNLEAVLRALADNSSTGVPAADPQYAFSWSETYKHTDVRENLEQGYYPECTQHHTQCDTSEGTLVYLGTGSEQPLGCESGEYINCYSETETTEFEPGETQIGLTTILAKQKAMEEVRRLIPYAQECSGGEGCAAVEIEDLGSGNAQITVQLEAPLTQPLSSILGTETVHVSTTKKVNLELMHVGG
ncbi:MAG: hypothetical protein KDD66_03510 [Bdellovibrionales bacterium]|nr:hypothetical protein [Bdellovibrionales bacterium]